ncbi:unnamed protein product [Sphenostylis stenocarpa]|uniref:Uncharacterized protein n=1 Tax=Sphenostylis stenocarpa TaxID=92480 RepID=A0AA86SX83_9FABA|nr:unnamed protein product [Sphenostylis stenocarpa]
MDLRVVSCTDLWIQEITIVLQQSQTELLMFERVANKGKHCYLSALASVHSMTYSVCVEVAVDLSEYISSYVWQQQISNRQRNEISGSINAGKTEDERLLDSTQNQKPRDKPDEPLVTDIYADVPWKTYNLSTPSAWFKQLD